MSWGTQTIKSRVIAICLGSVQANEGTAWLCMLCWTRLPRRTPVQRTCATTYIMPRHRLTSCPRSWQWTYLFLRLLSMSAWKRPSLCTKKLQSYCHMTARDLLFCHLGLQRTAISASRSLLVQERHHQEVANLPHKAAHWPLHHQELHPQTPAFVVQDMHTRGYHQPHGRGQYAHSAFYM